MISCTSSHRRYQGGERVTMLAGRRIRSYYQRCRIPFLLVLMVASSTFQPAVCARRRAPHAPVAPAASKNNASNKKTTTTTSAAAAWLNGCKNAAASAAAAACVKTLLQPIDAIKTVQQYAPARLSLAAAASQLWQRPGGVGNFYAGLGVTVVGAMPSVGLYFGVYSYCKQRLLHGNSKLGRRYPTCSIAASAAVGNTVASFSRVPYEVIKQKLQAGIYPSTRAALKDLILDNPSRSAVMSLLFPKGGVYVQMIRDIPYAVITLLLYESLQKYSKQQQANFSGGGGSGSVLLANDFVVGGLAGGVGSWLTNPMDVVKTRLQTDTSGLYGGSVATCARHVWTEGGPAAFLRGSVPRLVHKVPANAFFFLFYEFFKGVLKVKEESGGNGAAGK